MTDKRVLFFSCEAGGAEVLAPVVDLLASRPEFHVSVASYGHAKDRFERRGIDTIAIQPIERNDHSFLESVAPDLVITSATSLPAEDMSEKFLWRHARHLGIPSLAFLDQWQNYAARFSGTGDAEYMAFQPDYINCINELGHREMMAIGFSSDRLLTLGHPYLDNLAADSAAVDVDAIRDHLGIGSASEVVLFVSEPIKEYCGSTRGYDQYTVLSDLLSYYDRLPIVPAILIKLHPKDHTIRYRNLIGLYDRIDVHLLERSITPLESILTADRIFGMSSIMLLEAFVLGKPVASMQPNLRIDDPCVLSKYGYIRRIEDVAMADSNPSQKTRGVDFEYAFDGNSFLTQVEKLTMGVENPRSHHSSSCTYAI